MNEPSADSGETPLHNALCKKNRVVYDQVVKVLLFHGAKPNVVTKDGAETGGFMRDCSCKGETPLHGAAAFGDEDTIKMLLDAGAKIDAADAHGDTPLSWYLRPAPILPLLVMATSEFILIISPCERALGIPHGVGRSHLAAKGMVLIPAITHDNHRWPRCGRT